MAGNRAVAKPSIGLRLNQRADPRVILRASITQMPALALKTYLVNQTQANPVIEAVEEADDTERAVETPDPEVATPAPPDDDLAAFFADHLPPPARERPRPSDLAEIPDLENLVSSRPDLAGHLLAQLHALKLDANTVAIGEAIVGNLDERGYLVASVEDVAVLGDWSPTDVERALAVVQHLDPVGVAARSLQECLLIQLDAQGLGQSPAAKLVRENLPLLAARRFRDIARRLDLSVDDVALLAKVVRSLDPLPGARFLTVLASTVSPDVAIVPDGHGGYRVEMEDNGLPKLRINHQYVQLFQDRQADPAGRDFVRGHLERARSLLDALVHRERAIVRVVRAIADLQRGFLQHGVAHLRPLVLRDVANQVGLAVATVQRAVSHKYVATPQGVYPLKFFFSASLQADGGTEVSSTALRARLRDVIEAEDRTKPLSDAQIAARLRSEGVRVSRRWVTKHRESMRIGSSYERKGQA